MRLAPFLLPLLLAARPGSAQPAPGQDPYRPLSAYAATRTGDVAWAVIDGKGVLHHQHGSLHIRCASIVKAAILAALLQKAADEKRDLTSREQRLAAAMIIYSDNNSATALWNQLHCDARQTGGWKPGPGCRTGYFPSFLKAIGLKGTVPDPAQPYAWGYTLTTADDMALLASRLYNSRLATPKLCRYGLGLMTRISSGESWGLKDGLPAGAWIAFKNGWYPETRVWRVNSVGAIRPRSGPAYFMAVLNRYDVRLGMGYGIETIRTLSRLAYPIQTR